MKLDQAKGRQLEAAGRGLSAAVIAAAAAFGLIDSDQSIAVTALVMAAITFASAFFLRSALPARSEEQVTDTETVDTPVPTSSEIS